MKKMKFKTLLVAALVVTGFSFTSCEKVDEPTASVSINETGSDLGGDVTGDGGSTTKSYTWNNHLSTAGVGDDSKSGVTSSGVSGDWTITVTLTNFNGDGSFSLNPGD